MDSKKYLISGVGPGDSGASRFFEYILPNALENDYKILFPYKHKSLKRLLSKSILKFMMQLFKIFFFRILFFLRVLFIRNSTVFIMHPQGIGLLSTIILLTLNKKVKYYVLDNSFFCIRSYNYYDGECLHCLKGGVPFDTCSSFPGFRIKKLHLLFIKVLLSKSKYVDFFVQNINQASLVKIKFPDSKSITCVGMVSVDLFHDLPNMILPFPKSDQYRFNFVFHGSADLAKGLEQAILLAKNPYFSDVLFIFPFSKPSGLEVVVNTIFIPCSWETGLYSLVKNANCVMCLSSWSAPIEGALLKSIYCNGNILINKTEFGFASELPANLFSVYHPDCDFKSLKNDLVDINKLTKRRLKVQRWLVGYMNTVTLDIIFK